MCSLELIARSGRVGLVAVRAEIEAALEGNLVLCAILHSDCSNDLVIRNNYLAISVDVVCRYTLDNVEACAIVAKTECASS